MSLTIRRAHTGEFDACAALFERVVKDWSAWAKPEDLTAASIRATFENEEVYAAFDGDALVGFLSFYRPDDFVHSLFVERPRQGIGRALLDHVAASTDAPLTLKCSEPNTLALSYYAYLGWVEFERGETNGAKWRRLRAPL